MLIATTELIIEKYQKATDFKTVIRAGSSGLILEKKKLPKGPLKLWIGIIEAIK